MVMSQKFPTNVKDEIMREFNISAVNMHILNLHF